MNNELVTLSAEQSRHIRALSRAMGCVSIDHILNDLIFSGNPLDRLEYFAQPEGPFVFTPGEYRRIQEALHLAGDYKDPTEWEEFANRAEAMPEYNPTEYPDPSPKNVVELAPHLHLLSK
jgi:hypothetical protein